jgi:holo-[acyl-carrier protein] synthase
MRWAVGVDLEEVIKFEEALKNNKQFFTRTFSKREIRYSNSKAGPARHFAGTFAAKESVVKAVGQLVGGPTNVTDFEIVRSRRGVPSVEWLSPKVRPKALEIRVSISHTTHYAVAVALAMKR